MKAIKSNIQLIKSYPELKNFSVTKNKLKLARVLNFFKVKGFCVKDISSSKHWGLNSTCFNLHNANTEFSINYSKEDFIELGSYIEVSENGPGFYNFINSENLITRSGLFVLIEDGDELYISIKSKYFGEFSPNKFETFFKLFLEDIERAKEVDVEFKKNKIFN